MSYCRPALMLALLAWCAPVYAQAPVGDLSAADASVKGAVTMVSGGTRVMSGSSVTAGETAASLRLARGGELRVCPKTGVSITASASGRELMVAMNTGAIEAHYPLASSKDTVLTPDFRILLIGPGEFHLAIAGDAHGNTCVRTLERNSAAVVVEEQMGDGVHQLGAHDQALFHNGSVRNPDTLTPPDCGCPLMPQNLRAAASPDPVPRPIPLLESPDPIAPPPAANDVHVQVDAPFVFRAESPVSPPVTIAQVQARKLPPLLLETAPVLPPPAPPPAVEEPKPVVAKAETKRQKGVFGHLRSFFAAVFH